MFVETFHTRSRLLFAETQRLYCHDRDRFCGRGISYCVVFYLYSVLGKKHHLLLIIAVSDPLFPPELTAPQVFSIPFSFSLVAKFNTVSILQHSWNNLTYFPNHKIRSYKSLCPQCVLKRFHCSSQRANERSKLLSVVQQLCRSPHSTHNTVPHRNARPTQYYFYLNINLIRKAYTLETSQDVIFVSCCS